MTDPRKEWSDAGDKVSALLLKLKLHAKEELSDEDLQEKSGLQKLGATIEEFFDGMGDAIEDEAVRDDAREAGRAMMRALEASVKVAGDKIRNPRS